MAASLFRRSKVVSLVGAVRKTADIVTLTSNRSIMTGRARLEKVVEDLQKNPYFEKYATKIAKLQETSPEEFMERIEEKERQIKAERVFSNCLKQSPKPQWSWSITSHMWRTSKFHRQSIRAYSTEIPKSKYITTPIFYVNAAPHIGHLYSAVLADTIARYNWMQGYVPFLNTGTDEHGNKVEQAAKIFHLPTDKYCDVISQKFKEMCDTFDVAYSSFIRTTHPDHQQCVHNFWKKLEENNHIYKGKYSGWYCTSEEAFLSNQDLIEKTMPSGETIKVSAESGHPVEWAEEENYKFRLSAFQDDLKYWLKDEKVVQPSVFHKILMQWVEEGSCLVDLSVSRPASRTPWGILTPNDPNQTIYVWFDALVNYLSVLGYPDEKYKMFWPPTVQVIGKDILKFHGVYWPAFLIAAGLEPPKTLLCHSHWTVDDEKMSKSKGNVVSPFSAGQQFTNEGLRYFLLRDSVPHNDSNYSTERVLNIVNSELADTLGNLVRRCTGKVVNPRSEIPNPVHGLALKSESAAALRENIENLGDIAQRHYESFYIHHAVDAAMATLKSANVMLDHHKPWHLRKELQNPIAVKELRSVIALALETVRVAALVLYPVVPRLSTNLLDSLSVPIDARKWCNIRPRYHNSTRASEAESFRNSGTMVFPKIKLQA